MPKCGKYYKDKEKLKQYRKRSKEKYYNRNKDNCFRTNKVWTKQEIELILTSTKTDLELSEELGRSINAIQIQRSRQGGGIKIWQN